MNRCYAYIVNDQADREFPREAFLEQCRSEAPEGFDLIEDSIKLVPRRRIEFEGFLRMLKKEPCPGITLIIRRLTDISDDREKLVYELQLFRTAGVRLLSLEDKIDTGAFPDNLDCISLMSVMYDFQKEISKRSRRIERGLDPTKSHDKGRRFKTDPELLEEYRSRIEAGELTVNDVAEELGISKDILSDRMYNLKRSAAVKKQMKNVFSEQFGS